MGLFQVWGKSELHGESQGILSSGGQLNLRERKQRQLICQKKLFEFKLFPSVGCILYIERLWDCFLFFYYVDVVWDGFWIHRVRGLGPSGSWSIGAGGWTVRSVCALNQDHLSSSSSSSSYFYKCVFAHRKGISVFYLCTVCKVHILLLSWNWWC